MVYFFSYGDDKYKNSKIRIYQEALRMGFDDIKIYGPEDISVDFLEKTTPYISHPRGGGYWLWKAFFLKNTFDRIQDGDYVIYADAGCTINQFGKDRLQYYFDLMDSEQTGIFRFSLASFKEEYYTTNKVFEFFGKDNDVDFMGSDHLMATVMIFKKCDNSTEFINRYYDIALNHPEIFSDDFNNYKKRQNFKDHRHDQSVSSCLAKIGKFTSLSDETYGSSREEWIKLVYEKKIPILATRIRG